MGETWIVRIAKASDECPFRGDINPSRCYHGGNKTGVCKKDNCKIRVVM